MAHQAQMHFFGSIVSLFPNHFRGYVLDVGALDINGGPQTLFIADTYIGTDLSSGKNISLVGRGEELELPSNYFDVAMSSECFEHNPNWRSTFHNMVRMTKPGGIVIFSCAGVGRPEHGTTRSDGGYAAPLATAIGQEYYKNVTKKEVLNTIDSVMFTKYSILLNHASFDLYFIGIKEAGDISELNKLIKFEKDYKKYLRKKGYIFFVIPRFFEYSLRKILDKYPHIKFILKFLVKGRI